MDWFAAAQTSRHLIDPFLGLMSMSHCPVIRTYQDLGVQGVKERGSYRAVSKTTVIPMSSRTRSLTV
jgi:hypothetical protein